MHQEILDLKHAERKLPNGGLVLALNTGAIITPEDEAMLQALHSRSSRGIKHHLEQLAQKGSGKFMSSFYVGYNHKSIGDCGTGSIFIEGVSMLVAKAIQDWMLYSGQESSTRYIDFATQTFIGSLYEYIDNSLSNNILENWRQFYLESQSPLRDHLRKFFPRKVGEDESAYEKAINARSFDVLGAFLPAGASTNLAWHSNLRQIADHLVQLRNHPLREVKNVAAAIEEVIKEAFPNSFGHKIYPETEQYWDQWMARGYYFDPAVRSIELMAPQDWPEFALLRNGINYDLLKEYEVVIRSRSKFAELPKQIAECGVIQFGLLLDFRSYRDIQRQRSVIQRMPLLVQDYGFEPWYLEQMPKTLQIRADQLLETQKNLIEELDVDDPCEEQYYLPMGYRVPNRITGDLAAWTYIVELRAQATVHPTLHRRAVQIANTLEYLFKSYGLKFSVDRSVGRFDIKRGLQDITKR